ncbi:MAG: hypothetical protein ACPGVU_18485, partial [Limisphaerales bacterium]
MKPKRGRWWKAAVFVLGILCLPPALQWQLSQLELRRVLADYKSRGESLDWRDVVKPVPEGASNGRKDYRAAIAGLPKIPNRWLEWHHAVAGAAVPLSQVTVPVQISEYPAGFPSKITLVPKSVKVITNIWPQLDSRIFDGKTNWMYAERASTNDIIDMEIDWTLGAGIQSTDYIGARDLIAWTRAAVIHDLRKGERESARRRLTVGWRLLGMHDEPALIAALVRIAGGSILTLASWELLVHDGWSDDQLATLQQTIDRVRFVDSMERAIRQERCAGIQRWHQWREDPGLMARNFPPELMEMYTEDARLTGMEEAMLKRPWIWRSFVSKADAAWMLENYHLALNELRAGCGARSQLAYSTAWPEDRKVVDNYLFSRVSRVAFKRCGEKVFRAETQRELLVTAIAIKRYRLEHGSTPAAIPDLVPKFLP